MRKPILLAAVAALFLVALPVASATAAPPEQVMMEGPAYFEGNDEGTGFFTATGPAEASGTVCPTGETVDLLLKAHQTPKGVNLQVLKEFTCDDGSGTFQVKLQVRIPFMQMPTFNWVVVGGTDTYENLKGNGNGYGDHPITDGVWDVYEGKLH